MKRLGGIVLIVLVAVSAGTPASAHPARDWWVEYADVTVGVAPAVTAEQDLTTLLSKFLNDLYAGTFGNTVPITKMTVTKNAIGSTSTDGEVIQNSTASTVGTTVQMSPRTRWVSHAWNSTSGLDEIDSFFAEVLPATNAGTTTALWKLGVSINGGAATYPLTLSQAGAATISGGLVASGSVTGGINITTTSNTGVIGWANRGFIGTAADGLLNLTNNAITVGPQVNTGTAAPTVTTCGTGAPTAHSTNTAGEITPTGATACTVTFGAPNWTNQPFCTITVEAATVTAFISAISVSSFTVSALASGEKFMYVCFGGV